MRECILWQVGAYIKKYKNTVNYVIIFINLLTKWEIVGLNIKEC